MAAPSNEIESIVKELRNAGEPSLFILAEHIQDARETPPPLVAMSIAEMARRSAGRRTLAPLLKSRILERVRGCESRLESVRQSLSESARLDHTLTVSSEWLLDNAYLIRTNLAEVRRSLPRSHVRVHGRQYGYLFVSELADELVRYSGHALDENNIAEALTEYQRWIPLSFAELWSFPLLLRLSLIESLASLVERVDRAQQLRETAYFWANRLATSARRDPETLERTLHLLEAESFAAEPYFATCLIEQLQDEDRALPPTQQWIEGRLGKPLAEVVRSEHNLEAAERVSIANAFGSLRTLARLDFTKTFEATSLVEAELRTDQTHAHSDFATRDRSRKVIEEIAGHSGAIELEVARRAVALSKQSQAGDGAPLSYFLLGDGVTELERQTGARVSPRIRFLRGLRRRATAVYLGSTIGLTAWILALAIAIAWAVGVHHLGTLVVLGILALFPLSELAVQVVNALIISLLRPNPFPRWTSRKESRTITRRSW